MADEQPADELPETTNYKTSVAPLTPVDDQQPVVELPEMTDCTTRSPLFAGNTSPHPTNVQLPPASFPDREHTLPESAVLEPPQSSVVDAISPLTVRLPKRAVPQRPSSAKSFVTVRFLSSATHRGSSLSPCHHRNSKEKS